MRPTALALLLTALPAFAQGEAEPSPIEVYGDDYVLNFAEGEEDSLTLETFVAICEQETGIAFTYTEETANLLRTSKVRLVGTKRVPKKEFYSFFQIMMIINEFVCSEIGADPLSVVMIDSLRTNSRSTIRSDAIYVPPERLEEYANQPATLITTVIELPNTDVRQLSNSMRSMVTDANTQQMLPAGNTNAMVLQGFGSTVVAMARMFKIVDEASKVDVVVPEFEVIPLEYASAEEIASTIEELIEASNNAVRGRQAAQAQVQGATGAIAGRGEEPKILVDPRTNSLLVMAMPEEMPNIKQLVARLDVDVIERERSYHIYKLENVSAETLADTLDEFLDETGRLEAQAGAANNNARGGGAARSNTSEFVVVPDIETNSLLIAASRTRYEELISLIQRLDQPQAQVLIETALIELSSTDFYDIGVELGFAELPDGDGSGGFGVSGFGLSSIEDTDNDGVPDTRIPNVPSSGLSAGILDGDQFSLPVLIQLLANRQDSNVLNIPSILVNNNNTATVTSEENRPTVETNQTQFGQQVSQGPTVSAGIQLTISPSISRSRYLRLSIELTVSNFLAATQAGLTPPTITRTINTLVNVPDGDTMVVGGIIVDDTLSTRNKIPVLGDIPVIGALFRRDSNTRNRRALYFFVTPHILEDRDFADLAQISYQKKLEAADTIGFDRVQMFDPEFGKDKNEVDLSGFNLMFYSTPEGGEIDGEEAGMDVREVNQRLEDARTQGRDQ